MKGEFRHLALTERIIGLAYEVHNTLGAGFLEKVYEGALAWELRRAGLSVERQAPIDVVYKGERVGEYAADLIVEGRVIVEMKVVSELAGAHKAQLLNYLRATGIEVGLLINFGDRVEVVRRARSRQ